MVSKVSSVPHSWPCDESWPADIFPGSAQKFKHVRRRNMKALLAAGCLTRIGRKLVVIGAPYCKWIESQKAHVTDYAFHGTPLHAPKRLAIAKEPA